MGLEKEVNEEGCKNLFGRIGKGIRNNFEELIWIGNISAPLFFINLQLTKIFSGNPVCDYINSQGTVKDACILIAVASVLEAISLKNIASYLIQRGNERYYKSVAKSINHREDNKFYP